MPPGTAMPAAAAAADTVRKVRLVDLAMPTLSSTPADVSMSINVSISPYEREQVPLRWQRGRRGDEPVRPHAEGVLGPGEIHLLEAGLGEPAVDGRHQVRRAAGAGPDHRATRRQKPGQRPNHGRDVRVADVAEDPTG